MITYLRSHPLRATYWVLIATSVLLRMIVLSETDVFWYIRSGTDWLNATHPNLTPTETWDFSAAGQTWYPNSYLWNIVIAVVWHLGGLYALDIFNALCYIAVIALTWLVLGRLQVQHRVRYLLTLITTILLFVYFTDRANTADLLLLLLFMNLTISLLKQPRSALWLSLFALVFTAMAQNLHLSGLVFVVLLPSFALIIKGEKSIRQNMSTLLGMITGGVIGLFLTPFGAQGVLKSGQVAAASRGLILEWSAPSVTNLPGLAALGALLLACILGLILLVERRLITLAVLVVFICLTAEATRFGMYLTLLVLLIAAVTPWQSTNRGRHIGIPKFATYVALAVSVLLLLGGAGLVSGTLRQPAKLYNLEAADFTYLPKHARVLSNPATGSAILFFRPDVQVAIDSRNDLLGAKVYGMISDMYAYSTPQQFLAWADKNQVDAVFVNHADMMVREKMLFTGWREYDTLDGYTFVRTTVPAG